ncbi:hypothetical protein [Salinibius halmophilus]|uniref:hypothetical protein n=1 Tax=Salinibius halmophilus TaxID=1853216 RepID=UPI000E66DAA2|nr:hypothetical protein [Salinibius halmophilus]
MKRWTLLSATLIAGASFASNLDITTGQFEISTQSSDLRFGVSSSSSTNSAGTETTSNGFNNWGLSATGRYAISNALILGAYASIANGGSSFTNADDETTSTSNGMSFTISPTVEFYVLDTVALLADVSYSTDGAERDFDKDGEVTDYGWSYSSYYVKGGVKYRMDISPTMLMFAQGTAGIRSYTSSDADPDETGEQTDNWFDIDTKLGVKYFPVANFSINGDVYFDRSSRTGKTIDGEEVNLGESSFSYNSYGINTGFSIYFR